MKEIGGGSQVPHVSKEMWIAASFKALEKSLETNTSLEHLELDESKYFPKAAEAWQLAHRFTLLVKQRVNIGEVGRSCR